LDEAELTAFCGTSDCFVSMVYDQTSAGSDLIQPDTAHQPKIVAGGTILKENGIPVLSFDGIDDHFPHSISHATSGYSLIAAGQYDYTAQTGNRSLISVGTGMQGEGSTMLLRSDSVVWGGLGEKVAINQVMSSNTQSGYWAVGTANGIAYRYDSLLNYLSDSIDLFTAVNSGAGGQIHWGNFQPKDIAVDGQGRFYVIDVGYSDRVYRFTSDFEFNELSFDVAAQETSPESIEVDSSGNIYVGGRTKSVFVYDSTGALLTSYDLSAQLTLSSSQVSSIRIGLDGQIYIMDSFGNTIYVYDDQFNYTGSSFSTVFGSSPVQGSNPNGFTQNSDGSWVVTDFNDDKFHIYDNQFVIQSSVAQNQDAAMSGLTGIVRATANPGGGIANPDPDPTPLDTSLNQVTYWVTGYENGCVRLYDENLTYTADSINLMSRINAGTAGQIHYGVSKPRDMSRDSAGYYYVADIGYQDRIYRFKPNWEYDNFFIQSHDDFTESVDIGPDGNIYVSGRGRVVYKYSAQNGGLLDSFPLYSELTNPDMSVFGLRVGPDTNFYVLEGLDDRVFVYDQEFNYTGTSYDYTFSAPPFNGENGYGLVDRPDGSWVISDIFWDGTKWTSEFNIYDSQFNYLTSVANPIPDVHSGVEVEPIIPVSPANSNINGLFLTEMHSADSNSGLFYLNGSIDGSFDNSHGQAESTVGGQFRPFNKTTQVSLFGLIYYPSDQSSDRSEIRSIFNNLFNIY